MATKKRGTLSQYAKNNIAKSDNPFVNSKGPLETQRNKSNHNYVADIIPGYQDENNNVSNEGVMQQQDIKTTYATPNSTAPKLAPQKAMSFGEAFAQARKAGSNEFTWNGKKFNTDLKGPAASSKTKTNDEDHVYRPNTRNTVVPENQQQRLKVPGNTTAARDNTRVAPVNQPRMASPQAQERHALEQKSNSSYTLPTAEIIANRPHLDMSPALRASEVNRVLNKNRIANFPELPAYAGALASIPKKKRGGLATYVKNNYNG